MTINTISEVSYYLSFPLRFLLIRLKYLYFLIFNSCSATIKHSGKLHSGQTFALFRLIPLHKVDTI